MAYAELAGLPPITGLYTTILCLLGYAVLGPSRILVLGPDSSLGPMIAATVLPLAGAGGDPKRAVALASMLAIIVGAVMIAAAVAKLGFVADLISKPTMIGYMNGLALTILIGQLPKLFGFKVDAEDLIREAIAFVKGLAEGEAVAAAATVGICGIAVILVLQRWAPRLPRCSSWSWRRSRPRRSSASLTMASPWWGCCPRDSRRSPGPVPAWRTSGRCSPERSASPWCPWPTRSPPRRRSPPGPARKSTATAR
jgi:MFS superfamily sulfate permease-like transporter